MPHNRRLESKLVLVLLGLVCSSFLCLTAAAQLPDTPAARQFSAWLEAFNSGDRAVILKYFEANFPERVKNIDQTMNFRQRTGGFEFKKADESTPTRFSGIVKERNSEQLARFVIEVEAGEPHRISDFSLEAIPSQAEPPPPRMSESEALAALRAKVEADATSDKFTGAVLVAKNGKPIFT